MRREVLLVAGVIGGSVVLIGLLAVVSARPRKPIEDVTMACVQHTGVGFHIHPHLRVILDGEKQEIPAEIGIVSPRCMRPLHTHDDSGKLHLEFPVQQEVRLGQFFEVWKQPFSRSHILGRTIGDGDVLRVTVNGQETNELDALLLHDGDDILVEVKKK